MIELGTLAEINSCLPPKWRITKLSDEGLQTKIRIKHYPIKGTVYEQFHYMLNSPRKDIYFRNFSTIRCWAREEKHIKTDDTRSFISSNTITIPRAKPIILSKRADGDYSVIICGKNWSFRKKGVPKEILNAFPMINWAKNGITIIPPAQAAYIDERIHLTDFRTEYVIGSLLLKYFDDEYDK